LVCCAPDGNDRVTRLFDKIGSFFVGKAAK
jgi:hypothetical protein